MRSPAKLACGIDDVMSYNSLTTVGIFILDEIIGSENQLIQLFALQGYEKCMKVNENVTLGIDVIDWLANSIFVF